MRRVLKGRSNFPRTGKARGEAALLNPLPCLLVALFCFWVLPGRAAEAGANLIRLGYFPNITHAQALYGHATGEFEKATGVHIQWVTFNAGPAAIEALFVGAIDATFIGPGPTINGYVKSRGEKFVVLSGGTSGGAGLVVRKNSGIESERDFHG